MKRPAVFFDRDNTLIVSSGYLSDPAQVKLMPGAADAVARVRKLGFAVVIFSNQSGVARGMFDEDAVHEVNGRMESLLAAENAGGIIDRHEFCPFHPEGTVEHYRQDSPLRKPQPGMIHNAAEALALDLPGSWVIGDAPRDIEAGHAAGCRTILFRPQGVDESGASRQAEKIAPEYVVSTLGEAVDFIEKSKEREKTKIPDAKGKPEAVPGARQMPESLPTAAPPVATQTVVAAPVASPAPVASQAARMVVPLVNRAPSRSPPAAPEKPVTPAAPAPSVPASQIPTAEPQANPHAASGDAQGSSRRLEILADQILSEIRRHNDHDGTDFSVSKLLAGVVQMIALAILFIAFVRRDSSGLQTTLLLAIFAETLTIALLIMSRQK